MHKESFEQGWTTVHHRTLEGMHEAIDIMRRRERDGQSRLGEASLEREYEHSPWTGTRDMSTAIEIARFGWPEGREKLRRQIASIAIDNLVGERSVPRLEYDYSGDEVDVERFIAGNPENMINYEFEVAQKGKVATLLINCTVSAYVSAESIMKRGAAILAAHDVLKAAGYSLGITMAESTERGNAQTEYKIPIVEPGGFLDEDTLAFCAAHPAFLRRLVFALNENEDESLRRAMGYVRHGGYGTPTNVARHGDTDIVIDKHEGLVLRTDSDILRYARSIITRVEDVLEIPRG